MISVEKASKNQYVFSCAYACGYICKYVYVLVCVHVRMYVHMHTYLCVLLFTMVKTHLCNWSLYSVSRLAIPVIL